jgi:hypothetical protein
MFAVTTLLSASKPAIVIIYLLLQVQKPASFFPRIAVKSEVTAGAIVVISSEDAVGVRSLQNKGAGTFQAEGQGQQYEQEEAGPYYHGLDCDDS